jgi:TonB-linked SusC/RagA family outer membrane protein
MRIAFGKRQQSGTPFSALLTVAAVVLIQPPFAGVISSPASAQAQLAVSRPARVVRFDKPPAIDDVPVVLRQPITLQLKEVTLERALHEVTDRAGIALSYSRSVVPLSKRVSIDLKDRSVIEALGQLLVGAGVELWISDMGRMVLVPEMPRADAAETGRSKAQQTTITGRATGGDTNEPLSDARVIVVGMSVFAITNAEGRYTLRGVPVGAQEVRVIRVGYMEQKKPVTVVEGQTVTLDFVLARAVIQLQEVVTTATGDQRRVEIGNAVATIDVSKRVEASPIKNMGDLLTATAPGVQVLPSNMTGAGSRVRIRGTASLSLSNDPIYIIDGIRMTSTGGQGIGVGGTVASRVNDINPEEIETIEVVKGPSAATLYGTDAANGVIVISTKKGRAGAAQWSVYGETGLVTDRNDYPTMHAILGHTTQAPTRVSRCYLHEIALGTCIKDSTTSVNVFSDPDLTPIKDGFRGQGGLQVSGGTDVVRFFAAAEHENEIGTLGLPEFERRRFDSLNVQITEYMERPNTMRKSSFRTTVNAALSSKLDVGITSNFIKLDQRLPQVDNNSNSFWYNGTTGPGFKGAGPGYTAIGSLGQSLFGWRQFTPGDIFQHRTTQNNQRLINSGTVNWRPFSWMQNRADFGVDLSNRSEFQLCMFATCADNGTNRLGRAIDLRANIRNVTTNVGSTATWQPKPWLGVKSTGGMQFVYFTFETSTAQGSTLPPGARTPSAGAIPLVASSTTVTKTLGLFVEEQLALNDRLFITGAVRTDQNSAFGTNFQRVFYPKGGISWVVSDESFFPAPSWLSQFRLRGAVGSSGVQPGPNDALRTFGVASTNIMQTEVASLLSSALGNSDLKPERSQEIEVGFDARLFSDRVNVEFTHYRKKSQDALISQIIAPSAGTSAANLLRNLGSVKNWGYEALVTTQLLDTRNLSWDLTLNGSHNSNELVTLGTDALGNPVPPIIGNVIHQRPGYPLNGYWQTPFSYNDANKDGIIVPSEVTIGDSVIFRGYSQPRLEISIINGIDLFNRRLRVQGLLDHKSGYKVWNVEQQFLCQQTPSCSATSSLNVPLFEQARAVAQRFVSPITTLDGYIEDASFWRLREMSAAYTLHDRIARYARAKGATLVFAARNLAVWSDWTGVDPEQNYSQGDRQETLLTAGPPRHYTVRVNLRY